MQVWSKMDFGTGEIIFLDITQKEDMLQVEYPNCFLLDMGWYQDRYIISIIQNFDWTHPVQQYEPDKTEHDFAELKALSDQIYYEQDRAESAQTRKDVSIHGLEETEHCATRALDEEWEERVVDIQNRKYAWKALEQLFTVGALTEVQKRRFRLHVFQGLSTRQIGRMEGTSHQAVAKSINLAIAKLKKYFAAQG